MQTREAPDFGGLDKKMNCALPLRILMTEADTRVSIENTVLKNFAKFTEKHLCRSLFFNKAAGLRDCNYIKKETLNRRFP